MRWQWHKVRRANIPSEAREAFERTGYFSVAAELSAGFPPAKPILRDQYPDGDIKKYAHEWVRERADRDERHEDRLETVEWAILIFVVVAVILDLVRLCIGR
jgi:hypothetical protein